MRYTREDGCRVWLTTAMLRPDALRALMADSGSAEQVYDRFCAEGDAFLRDYATPGQMKVLRQYAPREQLHRMLTLMLRRDLQLLSEEDALFPDALRDIPDAPVFLYAQGRLECLNPVRAICVVGSRRASVEGLHAAERIAAELSSHGVTIVSGLASGIDTAAHTGCLRGGSPTIAVMGCGLDQDYPAENRALREQLIAQGGAVLSEYAPGVPGLKYNFPYRNRLMSGLSRAVLMIESRRQSGTMSTVHHALDQGREVYAYPGQPGTEWAEGAHQLLREGAHYFASAEDVLEDMGWLEESAPRQEETAQLPPLDRSGQAVMAQLRKGNRTLDELAEATGLDTAELNVTLTMLTLAGLVKSLPGKLFTQA